MTLKAGSAASDYTLDISGVRKAVTDAKKLIQELRQEASKPLPVPSVPKNSNNTAKATADEVKLQQALARTAEAEARRANATARKTEYDSRASRAIAQAALLEQKQQTELAKTTAAQDRAAVSALRRADAEKKASQNGGLGPALPRTFAGFTPGGFNQALGAFGLATLGPQIVSQTIGAGFEAGKNALALRETKNSLRAVAGDLNTYKQVLSAARQQQQLFGGTLQENIEGLSGLTITARSSGASLQSLINLSQRLAVLDPAQGAEGARIALNEALSGDPTSLAKRYEIPRAALQKLRDTTLPVEERLKVIDQYLTKVGISSDSVASKVDQDALAFRKLGQELGDLKLNAGDQLATAFSGAATGLGRVIGLINQNPQAIAELKALIGGKGTVTTTDLNQAAQDVARSRASRLLSGNASQPQQRQAITNKLGGKDEAEQVAQALTKLELAGEGAAQAGERVTQQFIAGEISATQYKSILNALVEQQTAGADAEDRRVHTLAGLSSAQDEAANKLQQFNTEVQKSAEASTIDAAKKDILQTKTALLSAQTNAAAQAFLNLNPGIDAAGIGALIAAGKIDPLIGQLAQLQIEAGKARAALAGLPGQINPQTAQQNENALRGLRGPEATRLAQARVNQDRIKQQQALADATTDRINRTGTLEQKLTQRQKEQDDAIRRYGKDSVEAYNASTSVIEAQSAVQEEAERKKKKGGGASKGLGALTTDSIKLADDNVARLKVVNDLLEHGKLTTHQRNQLLIEQRDLEEKIGKEKEKQNAAAIDANIAAIEDRKARRTESRQINALTRALQRPNLTGDRRASVEDELALVQLGQQRRALQLNGQIAAAGGVAALGNIAPVNVPNVPLSPVSGLPVASQGQSGGVSNGATIVLQIDSKTFATAIAPSLQDLLIGKPARMQSARGG